MPQRNSVVGASAGGLDVLKTLVKQLPSNLPASIFVVWHMMADSPGLLPEILASFSHLPVTQARDGEVIEAGHIYVAASDHHLILDGERVRVTHGPKENRFRPSVDVLFRSAALNHGTRVIGVVLSGLLDDGAWGVYAIKEQGGVAVVQDPVGAPYFEMPTHAMRTVKVDHVLPINEISALLTRLMTQPEEIELSESQPLSPMDEGDAVSDKMKTEVRIALEDSALYKGINEWGEPSTFTCPECHGVLLEIQEGNRTRFRCHTGHAYSWEALMGDLEKSIEETLWTGLRAIQESEMLYSHLAKHLTEAEQSEAAQWFEKKAEGAKGMSWCGKRFWKVESSPDDN